MFCTCICIICIYKTTRKAFLTVDSIFGQYGYKQVSSRNVCILVLKLMYKMAKHTPWTRHIYTSFNIAFNFFHIRKHSTQVEIFSTLSGFSFVNSFFFLYIIWCRGFFLLSKIRFLYTFRSLIKTHYLSLVEHSFVKAHASPCVNGQTLFVTSRKYM